MAQTNNDIESFPPLDSDPETGLPTDPYQDRRRGASRSSSLSGIVRRLSREFPASAPPEGFTAATSNIASTVVAEASQPRAISKPDRDMGAVPVVPQNAGEKPLNGVRPSTEGSRLVSSSDDATITVSHGTGAVALDHTEPFGNGYHFPPKYTWKESTRHGLAAFWKFVKTPMGFFWTIYGLNVVAWGGMIFLLLLNAAPAMCYPSCDDIDSPRRKWIEWDAQILTVLFCVTAFGLAPWRFRDLWYLLKYRIKGDHSALQRLAGIHRSWFRLKGSQDLPVELGPGNIPEGHPRDSIPIPEKSMPDAPLTGTRAPATAVWKLDFAIWCMVINTLAQIGLCGIMWGMDRYIRPSWATGFLVAVGMIIAMVGGWPLFADGKKVKSIEGVPLTDEDKEKLARDKENGVLHYNNLKAKKPKAKELDAEAGREK